MQSKSITFIVILLIFAFLFGLYGSPAAYVKPETDIQIDPEYFSGILTASSILFGLWAVVLGTKQIESKVYDKETKEFLFKTSVRELFFLGFLLLVTDVMFVVLDALKIFSHGITLLLTATAFFYNAVFLIITLHYFVFE